MYYAENRLRQDRSRSPLFPPRTLNKPVYNNPQAKHFEAFPWELGKKQHIEPPSFADYTGNRSVSRTKFPLHQDQSPLQVQKTISRVQEYDHFFKPRGLYQSPGQQAQTVVIFGLNRPAEGQSSSTIANFEQLRLMIRKDFLQIADRDSYIRKAVDQDVLQQSDEKVRMDGSALVVSDDNQQNFMQIKYSHYEDAESAVKLNLKEYTHHDVRLVIGVRLKEKPIKVLEKKRSTVQAIEKADDHRRIQKTQEYILENDWRLGMVDRFMSWFMPQL